MTYFILINGSLVHKFSGNVFDYCVQSSKPILTLDHQSLYSWTRLGRDKFPDRSTDFGTLVVLFTHKAEYVTLIWPSKDGLAFCLPEGWKSPIFYLERYSVSLTRSNNLNKITILSFETQHLLWPKRTGLNQSYLLQQSSERSQ